MTGQEFIKQIRRVVYDASVDGTVSDLQAPSGRNPSKHAVAASRWFRELPGRDVGQVRRAIALAAREAVFGMLAVLDGVRQIESSAEKGDLELRHLAHGESVLLNDPTEECLHDLFMSELDIDGKGSDWATMALRANGAPADSYGRDLAIESLEELSSRELQERRWLADGKSEGQLEVSSFDDAVCDLFGGTGLDHLLDKGKIAFSVDTDALLRDLGGKLKSVDVRRPPEEIINDPKLDAIRSLAKEILSMIREDTA